MVDGPELHASRFPVRLSTPLGPFLRKTAGSIIFRIDNMETRRPACRQKLFVGADNGETERLQLQRQGQVEKLLGA